MLCLGLESARWPDGPPQSGVAHGFSQIPDSGVGVVVGDERMGRNGVEGTFNKDMTNDEMTFLDTQMSLLSLIPPFFVFPPLRVPLLPLMVPR